MSEGLPIIYVFCNTKCEGRGDWHEMIAVDDATGEGLAGHVCSHHGWAAHDMGIDEDGWKRDIYAKRHPGGFVVRWTEGEELAVLVAKWKAMRHEEATA